MLIHYNSSNHDTRSINESSNERCQKMVGNTKGNVFDSTNSEKNIVSIEKSGEKISKKSDG